jgi:hypothetical protein
VSAPWLVFAKTLFIVLQTSCSEWISLKIELKRQREKKERERERQRELHVCHV